MTWYLNSSTGSAFNSCTAQDLPADKVPNGYVKIDDFTYTPTNEQKAENVRAERDKLLRKEVDPIVANPLRWADMSAEKQNQWAQYRNFLLEVPQQSEFPINISWPTKPS